MAYAKYYLDTRRKMLDGCYPIKVYLKGVKSYYLSTDYKAREENWSGSEFNGKERNHQAKNVALRRLLNDIEVYLLKDEVKMMPDESLKRNVQQIIQGKQDDKILFTDWMERAASDKAPATKGNYLAAQKHVKEFDPYCVFSTMPTRWLYDFEAYLERKGVSPNTRFAYLNKVRATFNYAIDQGATTLYPFRRFKVAQVPTRKRSLSVHRLAEIATVSCLYRLRNVGRDIFMLSFYLIGINMKDLMQARHEDVRDGRLEYKRAKTGRLYSVKIEPEAWKLIEKYRGVDHLLRFLDKPGLNYQNMTVKVNGNMKVITGDKSISTYWARHSWATIAASLDIPKETISAALGHELGNRITSIYIDYDQKKVDAANRLVIDTLNRAILEATHKQDE